MAENTVRTGTLIVGAGVSGLAFANFAGSDDYLIIDANPEIGGYCRTIKQDGFTWDFSGHFFHFRYPEIEAYLVSRMPRGEVRRVAKSSKIRYGDRLIDFPFQKNIHQLPQDEFIECLYDVYFREDREPANFKEMLYAKFGRGICERFLVPYNEKLYACDLSELDQDAMGRFFPHANVTDIIRNFRQADNGSYNSTFTYPQGGAIEYVRALASEVPEEQIALNERLLSIDLEARVATTDRRRIVYDQLVSSAPFNRLAEMSGLPYEPAVFTWNKVLVFNLGFDRKGWSDVHWVYFPERKYSFYRVGFYDNIFGTDRMSLYVEIGLRAAAEVNVNTWRQRVLEDLASAGIVDGHQVVSEHAVLMDPAYVHITRQAQEETQRLMEMLRCYGVHSIGRYGGWKYCSIEDNILEARSLAVALENQPAELMSAAR
jgi:protoporphyrinogen oxidase